MKIKPGFFLALEFSATGGVSYKRDVLRSERHGIEQEGMTVDFATKKTVDHVGLAAQSAQILQTAYAVVNKHAVKTPLGYWVDPTNLADLQKDLAIVQDKARTFCNSAVLSGSARRVSINVYPLELAEDNEIAAKRIAKDIRDRLTAVIDAFRTGDRTNIKPAMESIRHLERMASGWQADSVVMAQEHAKLLNRDLGAALRSGSLGIQWADSANFEPIQAAIQTFAEVFVPEVLANEYF